MAFLSPKKNLVEKTRTSKDKTKASFKKSSLERYAEFSTRIMG